MNKGGDKVCRAANVWVPCRNKAIDIPGVLTSP